MFDTTAYGEYKSFSRTQLERSQARQEQEEDEEEEDEDEDAEGDGGSSHCEIKKKKKLLLWLVNGFIKFSFSDCDDNATSQRTERKAK